jgi:hypothetical protein
VTGGLRRAPGEQVVLQDVWRGDVWAARPMTVVRDEDGLVALWLPKGTMWKAPTTPPTREREPTRGEQLATCLALGDWALADSAWGVDTLVLMQPGAWHALWVSWLESGEQWGWYVNLQEPFRRTPKGFETMDLVLDVVIELDGTWRWKDEDELEAFVARGVFDRSLAERIRDEGLRVARHAERNEGLFGESWHGWRPDPSLPAPELPAGWDEPWR